MLARFIRKLMASLITFQVAGPLSYVEYIKTQLPVCLYVRVKAIQLQAWAGPEVSRRLRLPDIKTVGT